MDEPLGSNCTEASDGVMTVGEFQLINRLGEGSYGAVFQGLHQRTKKVYAIKMVPLSLLADEDVKRVRHEAQMMQGLHHSNVVQFYQILHTPSAYYFVMELAEGGELFDRIIASHHFGENTARKYFQQLISAIYHCHANGIAHGDLKAENLLLDKDGRLKICDFGLSKNRFDEEDMTSTSIAGQCGTTSYMSPELFDYLGGDMDGTHTIDPFRADLYAAGVILFFMLSGNLPFEGHDEEEIEHNIRTANYDEEIVPPCARTVVAGLLEPDPKKRFTLNDILENEWFLVNVKQDMFPTGKIKTSSCNQRQFCDFKKLNANRACSTSPEAIGTPLLPSPEDTVTEEEEEILKRAFDSIDIDHNGDKITKDELRDCLISLTHGAAVTDEDIEKLTEMFHPADKDGITFDEFKDAWINRDLAHCPLRFTDVFQLKTISTLGTQHNLHCPREKKIMKELRAAFNTLDVKHTGLIDSRNIKEVFQQAGVDVSDSEATSLVHAMASLNHNNKVSFDEFVNAIAHEDILVKHPVGRRLASAANLKSYASVREFEELVMSGMTIQGTTNDTLGILTDASSLIHMGHCADGVCHTSVLGPAFGSSSLNSSPHQSSQGGATPPIIISPATIRPVDGVSLGHSPLPLPEGSGATLQCGVGTSSLLNDKLEVHTFQFVKEAVAGGLTAPVSGANMATPRSGQATPRLGMKSGGGTPMAESLNNHPGVGLQHPGGGSGAEYAASGRRGSGQNSQLLGGGASGVYEAGYLPGIILTPQRRPHYTPCIVDVKLRTAACNGYTIVKVTRISGSTKDFHDVVRQIGQLLQDAREQALRDSEAVDDGELM